LAPTWVFTSSKADTEKVKKLRESGVKTIVCKAKTGQLFCREVALYMGNAGLNSILVEGGGKVAASFFTAGLIDRVYFIRAPSFAGAGGVPAISQLGLGTNAQKFVRTDVRALGSDILEVLERGVLN
jgi:diaminohydroxyphosphoribosylaminopyrimidine deaminase/5-amino-6-(5-phosphoribosylamino)uracil reductase